MEFVRQSSGKRLTLVLHDTPDSVCSFWARMTANTPREAVRDLATREGTSTSNIGQWPEDDGSPNIINLGLWASSRDIDYVIWTALGPKFHNCDGACPTEDEAVQ